MVQWSNVSDGSMGCDGINAFMSCSLQGLRGLEVIKVSLFIGFPPCPGGALRFRSCQSLAIYRVPPLAQVAPCALEVTKVSLFIVYPPAQVGTR